MWQDGNFNTVYLVDDDASVLHAVARLLRSEHYDAHTFSSADRFLDFLTARRIWGCAVLDLAMPGMGGLELQRKINELHPGFPVLFLTGRGDIHTTVDAMKHGAVDFLTKPIEAEHLLQALRSAFESARVTLTAHRHLASIRSRLATLTPREYEVLIHVTAGKLNKQIAAELGTVEKTIKVHRARMLQKMGVQSAAELARMAERVGIAADSITVGAS